VGTVEGDVFRGHAHAITPSSDTRVFAAIAPGESFQGIADSPLFRTTWGRVTISVPSATQSTGGNETRPINVAVHYIIKN